MRSGATSVIHKAREIATNNGGTTLEALLDSKSITLPEFSEQTIEIWEQVSKEYAEKATGEVKVILGDNVSSTGVWNRIELPALKNNPNVTKIIAINPETLIETLIPK